jgi:hypothetical protein
LLYLAPPFILPLLLPPYLVWWVLRLMQCGLLCAQGVANLSVATGANAAPPPLPACFPLVPPRITLGGRARAPLVSTGCNGSMLSAAGGVGKLSAAWILHQLGMPSDQPLLGPSITAHDGGDVGEPLSVAQTLKMVRETGAAATPTRCCAPFSLGCDTHQIQCRWHAHVTAAHSRLRRWWRAGGLCGWMDWRRRECCCHANTNTGNACM